MDSPLTRAAYERNLRALAARAVGAHEIRERGPGRWYLQRPRPEGGWCWSHAAEVVLLRGGRVLVCGDVDPVIFAGFGADAGEDAARAALAWVAGMAGRYLVAKAAAGLKVPLEAPDSEVAAGELLQRAAARIEENVCDEVLDHDFDHAHDDDDLQDRDRAALDLLAFLAVLQREIGGADPYVALQGRAAARLLRGDPLDEVKAYLLDGDEDPASLYHLGDVTDGRVFYAQAVVQRLCVLLDAEAAASKPAAGGAHG